MLTELLIKDVAIIDRLRIRFGPGLTVLTGETGAGKSIIIDALTLLSGGRASQDLIRSGADEAQVEGIFDVGELPAIQLWLDEHGFEAGPELVVKRRLSKQGPNRIYLNGSAATLSQISDLGMQLITIHGQHESQGLLRPDVHLQLLDRFAGLTELRDTFSNGFDRLSALEATIERLASARLDRESRREILAYQIDELEAAQLQPNEELQVEEEFRLLSAAERLIAGAQSAYDELYAGEVTVLRQLGRVKQTLHELARVDGTLTTMARQLEEGYLQIEDAALALRDYASKMECDPGRLRQLEERRDLLTRLLRKYAPTVQGVLIRLTELKEEFGLLERADDEERILQREREELLEELRLLGMQLHDARVAAGAVLAETVTREIRELAMPHGTLDVSLELLEVMRRDGVNRLTLLFSANPGEPSRPLARVASGGELSRLMLALKQVLPEGEAPTMVFDEVDTGVSGAVASGIGRKLAHAARGQQLFCVTHLPQVAAWAGNHLVVTKEVHDGRAVTKVAALNRAGQIQELARLVAGEEVHESARTHAEAMLRASEAVLAP